MAGNSNYEQTNADRADSLTDASFTKFNTMFEKLFDTLPPKMDDLSNVMTRLVSAEAEVASVVQGWATSDVPIPAGPQIPLRASLPSIPLAPNQPAPNPNTYQLTPPAPPSNPGGPNNPGPAPIPLTNPAPTYNLAPPTPPGSGPQSPVSAYDRPQSVIILGPRPLPVTLVGGGGAGNKKPDAPEPVGGIGGIAQGVAKLAVVAAAATATVYAMNTAIHLGRDVINAYTGEMQKLNSLVAKFDPGTAYMFTLAIENLEAAMGRLLVPAIQKATVVIDAINTALGGVNSAGIAFVAGLAAAGAVTAVVMVVMTAVTVGLGALAAILTVVSIALDVVTLGAATIPQILGTLGTVGAAATGAAVGIGIFGGLMSDLGTMMAILKPILEAVVGSINKMAPRFIELAQRIAPILVVIAQLAGRFASMVVDILTAKGVLETLTAAMILMATPLILIAGAAYLATQALHALLKVLGLVSGEAPTASGGKTTAVSQANFQGAQQYAEKAYTSAYSLGETVNPDTVLLGNISTTATDILNWLKESKGRNAVVNAATEAGVPRGAAEVLIPEWKDFILPMGLPLGMLRRAIF